MGLLDEAIREHLELKRRRGADVAEIHRQEQEALGPARGVPEPLEAPAPAEEDVSVALHEPPAEPAPEFSEAPVEEAAVYSDEPHLEAGPVEALDPLEGALEHLPVEAAQEAPHEPYVEPEPLGGGPEAAAPPPPAPQETVAFDVAAELEADHPGIAPPPPAEPVPAEPVPVEPVPAEPAPAPAARETGPPAEPAPPAHEPSPEAPVPPPGADPVDVLEETPEFLQETPEHDRLWFEQKPPRDFDFDK